MVISPDYLLFLNNDIIPYFPQYFPPKENAFSDVYYMQ